MASGASETELIETAIRLLVADGSVSSGRREMQGRKHADAAFSFALAGVKNTTLFDLLVAGATNELLRYGHRTSCRTIDILQVVEKLAAAGIEDQKCYLVAADLLKRKSNVQNHPGETNIALLSSGEYLLFADRPLLWLWRYASNTQKHGLQFDTKANGTLSRSTSSTTKEDHVVQLPIFHDNTLPLIVDIGCGYGVSLLGLGYYQQAKQAQTHGKGDGGMKYNYLGCDMSPTSIGYAQSITARWKLEGTTHFLELDAKGMLNMLASYPGRIHGIHVNFPTPYKFEALLSDDIDNERISVGNAQLPKEMSTFMFTPKVVELCRLLLNRRCVNQTRLNDANGDEVRMRFGMEAYGNQNENCMEHEHGYLLLQSNVEDVCVTMKNIVLTHTRQRSEEKGKAENLWPGNDFILPDDRMMHELFGYLSDDEITDNKSTSETTTNTEAASRSLSSSSSIRTSTFSSDTDADYDSNSIDNLVNDDDGDCDNAKEDGKDYILQKRTFRWIASGGERAEGPHRGKGWIPRRLLPPFARTETEAMCNVFGKPVHRIVFAIRSNYH